MISSNFSIGNVLEPFYIAVHAVLVVCSNYTYPISSNLLFGLSPEITHVCLDIGRTYKLRVREMFLSACCVNLICVVEFPLQ